MTCGILRGGVTITKGVCSCSAKLQDQVLPNIDQFDIALRNASLLFGSVVNRLPWP